jgi:hypothetical protein
LAGIAPIAIDEAGAVNNPDDGKWSVVFESTSGGHEALDHGAGLIVEKQEYFGNRNAYFMIDAELPWATFGTHKSTNTETMKCVGFRSSFFCFSFSLYCGTDATKKGHREMLGARNAFLVGRGTWNQKGKLRYRHSFFMMCDGPSHTVKPPVKNRCSLLSGNHL